MQRELTSRDYWDGKHVPGVPTDHEGYSRLGRAARRLLGRRLSQLLFEHYADHILWDLIYDRCLPRLAGARVIEIGSAPGRHLVRLARTFGYEPFGVEYSEPGVAENRRVFQQNGLPPQNVIQADFFDPAFHAQHAGSFDVVVSVGFIEHFTDVDDVIRKHVNLLRPGGRLVVQIPNLRGLNYLLTRTFRSELIAMHNLTIMDKQTFTGLFDGKGVTPLYCDYYGGFSFWIFSARSGTLARPVLALAKRSQPLVNAFLRLVSPQGSLDAWWCSPYLLYVGIKQSA